jgi:hypothetical protein
MELIKEREQGVGVGGRGVGVTGSSAGGGSSSSSSDGDDGNGDDGNADDGGDDDGGEEIRDGGRRLLDPWTFSIGPRDCAGQALARMELQVSRN